MAIRPSEPDTFMREVDEELRKERLNQFVTRYGWVILAAIVLFLAAVGGAIWWKERQAKQAAEQGTILLEALEAVDAGNRNAAAPKLAELATSRRDGYRAAALFARAGEETQAGNVAAAAATLKSIAEDEDLAEPYRQAALVRQTALEFDRLQPRIVIQRLTPLARPGEPWFGSAGEMIGIAHLRMNRPDLAGPLFARIGRDETVPPSIRTRAIQMAGALGVDAMPGSGAGGGAAAAGPAAPAPAATAPTREKAE